MPRPLSNFSRYVIPVNLNPTGICCITVPVPNDRQWIAQFYGAIWRMSLQTNYERDDAHSGQICAAKWREVWEDVVSGGCCNGGGSQNFNLYIKNITTQIYIQTITQVWIDAALDVQVAFPGTPDDFDVDPGDVGAEIPDRNRALCMICQSYVDEMFNTGMSWIEDSVVGITAVGVGALAVPIIPVWLVGAGFSAVALALSALYSELQRTDYRSYMACALFDALKGVSTNNRGAFADAWDNLPVRPPPPEFPDQDIARDAIEVWARAQLSLEGNYVAFVSQLNAAMEIAGELTDNDCVCIGAWTHVWLNGFNDADDWDILGYSAPLAPGTYNALEDRFEGDCVGPGDGVGIRVEIAFATTVITNINVTATWNATRASPGNKTEIGDGIDFDRWASCSHGTGVGTHVCTTGTISQAMALINIRAFGASNNCSEGAYSRITRIEISGDGANPFL